MTVMPKALQTKHRTCCNRESDGSQGLQQQQVPRVATALPQLRVVREAQDGEEGCVALCMSGLAKMLAFYGAGRTLELASAWASA